MSDHFSFDSTLQQQPIPETDEIEGLLRTYRPTPGQALYEQVATNTWMKSKANKRYGTNFHLPGFIKKINLRWALGLIATLLMVVMFMAFTPQGRSFAQAISRYFQINPSDHATEVLSLTPMPTNDPGYPYNLYTLDAAQAEALAGFEVKELTGLPEGWIFNGSSYDPELQQVKLFYSLPSANNTPSQRMEAIYLYVSQQKGEFEDFIWGECPTGTISKVQVNNWPAELSDGSVWVTYTEPTPGITREWTCERADPGATMVLRWKETTLKYQISVDQFFADESVMLGQSDLINLAENMQ